MTDSMNDSTEFRVFLAHSKEDKPLVREIYFLLRLLASCLAYLWCTWIRFNISHIGAGPQSANVTRLWKVLLETTDDH